MHNPILLITLFAWKSLPPSWAPFLLTWNPSFASWCDSRPLRSLVGCTLTSPPPPFAPHSLFPFSQRFPISNTCPSTTTLRHRLHIDWYTHIVHYQTMLRLIQIVFSLQHPPPCSSCHVPSSSSNACWPELTLCSLLSWERENCQCACA